MKENIVIVKVNNIEVGELPLNDYQNITSNVKNDWRIRIADLLSLGGSLNSITYMIGRHFVSIMISIIAIALLSTLPDSSSVVHFISDLRSASSEDIASCLRNLTRICITLTAMSVTVRIIVLGIPFRTSNSDIAINNKIREIMKVPATGKVSVTFIERDKPN